MFPTPLSNKESQRGDHACSKENTRGLLKNMHQTRANLKIAFQNQGKHQQSQVGVGTPTTSKIIELMIEK